MSKKYIIRIKNTQLSDDQLDDLAEKVSRDDIIILRDADFDIITLELD